MILRPLEILPAHPVGGKASSLASLTQANFKIPPWFAVLGTSTNLPSLKGPHAVRSSAMSEDGAESSFAGQYDSFLNISPENIPAHIEKVRQFRYLRPSHDLRAKPGSHFARQSRRHCSRMVDAKFAGVAFGADPSPVPATSPSSPPFPASVKNSFQEK